MEPKKSLTLQKELVFLYTLFSTIEAYAKHCLNALGKPDASLYEKMNFFIQNRDHTKLHKHAVMTLPLAIAFNSLDQEKFIDFWKEFTPESNAFYVLDLHKSNVMESSQFKLIFQRTGKTLVVTEDFHNFCNLFDSVTRTINQFFKNRN